MAAENIANKVLSGTEGTLWINGEEIEEVNKVEIKIEGTFDDIELAGVYATMGRFMGWKGTGTITLFKMHSRAFNAIGDAFKTGKFPDIEIIAAVTNRQTGESERIALHGVQFTESDFNFETKKSSQEAIPFRFIDYDILETLS
jgi:hypothetical protein